MIFVMTSDWLKEQEGKDNENMRKLGRDNFSDKSRKCYFLS